MTELNRIQAICNNINSLYHAGLNDSYEVIALFDYANKNINVCVVIGYDTYNAVTAEQVNELYKNNPGAEVKQEKDGFSHIKMNYKSYRISTSLLNQKKLCINL